jgi:hypothetical protein
MTKHDDHSKSEGQDQDRKRKSAAKGPWPDSKAREQMSRAQSDRENLGKHSKNPDWEKKW